MTSRRATRAAIYTRKSSAEGLEQDFNSLDAQREACAAFIRSQTQEGWRLIKTRYDDGGQSGGTLERPALQCLLADIRAQRLEVVVIYKIDRLTRSLTDFAQLATLFDDNGVSFVAVTQPFITTTSMGRLMLNVLLSFAQFEREITGERIRDKIAASKQKGLWMGGYVPLGYTRQDRTLMIEPEEAATVRTLFQLYLEHGNVQAVTHAARDLGLVSKRRVKTNGEISGGRPFFKGHIYKVLRNPVYAGLIGHRGTTYPGQHAAIIAPATWAKVQAQLDRRATRHRRRVTAAVPGLLVGLLADPTGRPYTHTHAVKRGRRYRYYTHRSLLDAERHPQRRARRIPAAEIESVVTGALRELLRQPDRLLTVVDLPQLSAHQLKVMLTAAHQLADALEPAAPQTWIETLLQVLHQVVIEDQAVRLVLNPAGLLARFRVPVAEDHVLAARIDYRVPARIVTQAGQTKLIIRSAEPEQQVDWPLIRAIERAHTWLDRLTSGDAQSVRDIATAENLSPTYVMRALRLAFLAPDIVQAIVDGRQPPGLNLTKLVNGRTVPIEWAEQRTRFGFDNT